MLALCWNGKQGIRGAGDPEGILKLNVTALLIGASLLVLTVPVAHAQSAGAEAMAQPGLESPGRYLVTFGLDQATLTEQDRVVICPGGRGLPARRHATDQRHRLYRYLRFRGPLELS